MSDAPDDLLKSFELAVGTPDGTGVLDPDGVLVLTNSLGYYKFANIYKHAVIQF